MRGPGDWAGVTGLARAVLPKRTTAMMMHAPPAECTAHIDAAAEEQARPGPCSKLAGESAACAPARLNELQTIKGNALALVERQPRPAPLQLPVQPRQRLQQRPEPEGAELGHAQRCAGAAAAAAGGTIVAAAAAVAFSVVCTASSSTLSSACLWSAWQQLPRLQVPGIQAVDGQQSGGAGRCRGVQRLVVRGAQVIAAAAGGQGRWAGGAIGTVVAAPALSRARENTKAAVLCCVGLA